MTQDGFNYYDGEFRPTKSGLNFKNLNPCTEESIGKFPQSCLDEVNHVCELAKIF